jgi:hypothetical protein
VQNSAEEDEMGGLIPIGGGADAEIKDKLNAAFNDTNIMIVRDIVANENLFDQPHHLHRVAYRLGAYPTRTYTGDSTEAKGKWFYFLKTILKAPAVNSIKAVLSYAMTDLTVGRVVFDARQGDDPQADHYIYAPAGATVNSNPMIPGDIALLVDTSGTLSVALICPWPLPMTTAPVPNKPGDIDNGEKSPAKIFTPNLLAPPILDRKTRKPKPTKTNGKKKGKRK